MRIGEFMKRISAIAEQLDFNRVWELIILAAFRKWLSEDKTKGLLPQPLMLIDWRRIDRKQGTASEATEADANLLPQTAILSIQLPNLG